MGFAIRPLAMPRYRGDLRGRTSYMAAFTGTHDGYSYSADWSRADGDHIRWDAVVHTSAGNWCGHPNGTVMSRESSDTGCEARVRLAVETAIEKGENLGHHSPG